MTTEMLLPNHLLRVLLCNFCVSKSLVVLRLGLTAILSLVILSFSHQTMAQNGIHLELPLMVNDALSGNINAVIKETNTGDKINRQVSVERERLKQLLASYADEDQLIGWFSKIPVPGQSSSALQGSIGVSAVKTDGPELDHQANTSRSLISLEAIRQNGLEISYNPSLLSIEARVEFLGTRSISLRSRKSVNPEQAYAASNFSSGLNVRASSSYSHRQTLAADRGFVGTSVDFDGFTNIGGFGGWSLFYEGDYSDTREQKFARGDVTLIHDSYKSGVRYALGDVRPTSNGLQASPDLLGFNIERNYREVNPTKNIRPNGRATFTLERPSRVYFEVNGIIVETQDLEPGDYSVNDFPFTFGANDVRVVVDDGISSVEVANFTAFSNLSLLAPGLSTFGVSAGFQREPGGGVDRSYQDDPSLLGFYERGVSQNLTVGVQAEVSEDHALIGSSATYGSRYGLLGVEVALSNREGFDTGLRSILAYSNLFNLASGWSLNTNLQLDYQTSGFGGLTATGDTEESRSILSAISASKGGYTFLATGSSATVGESLTNTFSLGITKGFNLFALALNYNYSQTDDLDSTDSFAISVSGRFGGGTVRGQYRSLGEEYGLTWSGQSASEPGNAALSNISLLENDVTRSAQFVGRYINSKFDLDVNHTESRSALSGVNNATSRTDFRLASSIGFAGGRFAFGRPFNDGFIITEAHSNLRGKRVSIKRSSRNGSLLTSSKRLRSALIPIDNSYREQKFVIDVDDLPLGYDIGAGELDVFPGFLAGYHYKVGSDSANTVIGKVLWPDGSAPSLIVGKIVAQNGGEEVTIFTNKTGRFVAERMLAGKYSIIFSNEYDDFSGEIVIEKMDEPGLIRLDAITLEKVQL